MPVDLKDAVPVVAAPAPALLVIGGVYFDAVLLDTVQQWCENLVREVLDAFWSGMAVVDIAMAIERPPDHVAALIFSTF